MTAFWTLARRMLIDRGPLAGAVVAAVVSALGLGAGLLGVSPILDALIGRGRTLADIATDFNETSPVDIPEAVIAALPTDPFQATLVMVGVLAGLTLLGATANFAHMYLSLTVVERTIARIRRRLFDTVIRLPLAAVVADGASDPVSRVVNDPQQLGAGFSALLSKGLAQVTKGIAAFIAAIIVNIELTAITLLVVPLLAVIIRKLGKRIRRASRAALERQSGLYAAAGEIVRGLRVVKAFGTERRESARFHRENKAVLAQLLRVRIARALSSPLIETMAIFVIGGMGLIAVKAVNDNEIEPSEMILAISALGVAGASLRPLTGILNDIQQSAGAADRIAATLARAPEPGRERGLASLPPGPGAIAFEGVTFAYPGAPEPALRELTLTINPGETVALVGANGSGKTTLLSLIPRLFDPTAGRVRIDGADIAAVSVRSLRRRIGMVTQETVLFEGSIADNIAYGTRDATPARIEEAARRARAHDFIMEKGGYAARVGESGLTLSGGQRQRIAIARAVLRGPAILLLDEATSMIDADSEAHIAAALAEFSKGRTTLVIAHRLSTVANADRIAVLDNGRLVDTGRHAELLDRCPAYRRIAERQLLPATT